MLGLVAAITLMAAFAATGRDVLRRRGGPGMVAPAAVGMTAFAVGTVFLLAIR